MTESNQNDKVPLSEMKSFRLSMQAIAALENLSERLSSEAKVKISMAKTLELCIFQAETKSLNQLLKIK